MENTGEPQGLEQPKKAQEHREVMKKETERRADLIGLSSGQRSRYNSQKETFGQIGIHKTLLRNIWMIH